MKSNRGMALIAVMVILQVLMLFGLYAYQSNLWQLQYQLQFQHIHELKSVANKLLPLIEQTKACSVSVISPKDLINKPLSWWQTQSCAGNFNAFQYYYVTESLGKNNCALIEQELNASVKIAKYSRVTLLVLHNNARIMLQSTIATPTEPTAGCEHSKIRIKPGRQSWLQLI